MNKSKLQEFCHQKSWALPEYTTVRQGPDHDPRFTATVSVNGIPFHTSAFICRSSKEAQNQAAKLAFDHFTAPKTILQRPPNAAAVPEPSSGFPNSDAELNIKTSLGGILPPTMLDQNFQANQTSLNHEVVTLTKGNLYKNRLQNYAQKRNLTLPMYSCEIDGPPHARRFKARVTIDGNTHEAPEFFSTLKDAEHAAAKVAFEALPPDDIQEDDGLYKSLLQELALKMGFRFPVYETSKSGPPHMPVFLSSVEVGNSSFQGQEARTKKQAEMSAAKVAYTGLTKGKAERNGTYVSKVGQTMGGASVVSSSNLEPTVINKNKPSIMSIPNEMHTDIKGNAGLSNGGEQMEKCKVSGLATEKDANFSSGSHSLGAPLVKCSSLQTTVTKELQQQQQPLSNVSHMMELHIKSTDNLPVQEELAEKSEVPEIAKGQTSSSSDGHLRSPSKAGRQRTLVQPYKPNGKYTDGSVVHSDQKWVAIRIDQDQQ